tara:strand:- start:550 stop:1254 length:705 start_codon:yes stop_codon:yes gene_type:complete
MAVEKRGLTTVNDRLPKDNPGKNPTDQAQQNYTEIGLGNDKGSIKMGHVHKQGDVTAGIGLYTPDAEHQLSLDIDGERKGWTISTGPGAFQVECGSAMEEAENSVMVTAVNGDISIVATNGKIRLQGTDIELVAVGEGQTKGNIKLNATENVLIESKKVVVTAKTLYKLCTAGDAEVVANGVLELYGSIIRGVTDAVKIKDSKVAGQAIFDKNNPNEARKRQDRAAYNEFVNDN